MNTNICHLKIALAFIGWYNAVIRTNRKHYITSRLTEIMGVPPSVSVAFRTEEFYTCLEYEHSIPTS